jgi:hypothetical protein
MRLIWLLRQRDIEYIVAMYFVSMAEIKWIRVMLTVVCMGSF